MMQSPRESGALANSATTPSMSFRTVKFGGIIDNANIIEIGVGPSEKHSFKSPLIRSANFNYDSVVTDSFVLGLNNKVADLQDHTNGWISESNNLGIFGEQLDYPLPAYMSPHGSNSNSKFWCLYSNIRVEDEDMQ